MLRSVTAHLELEVHDPAELVLSVAVAHGPTLREERLEVRHDGAVVEPQEIAARHGGRTHRLHVPAGTVVVDYAATVEGHGPDTPVVDHDLLEYRRPSRYAESDRLLAFASDEFSGLQGAELLDGVATWVHEHVTYLSGSSLPTDGATDTLLKRRGVCRDFAHLVVALLRACDVPARLVAVYAPGLDPMDFHAVAEAYVEGAWHVVDATRLAPRGTLLRIATGRDAADTAFLETYGGTVDLTAMTVTAVADLFTTEDATGLVRLG